MNLTWAISSDGEHYSGCDFPTKEDAIADGKAYYDGDTFYVGQCVPPPQPETIWRADDWLEQVSCQDEYSGDWAEGWEHHSREQLEELEKEVRAVMAKWLDRHNLRPTFFNIANDERITPEEDEQEKETEDLSDP